MKKKYFNNTSLLASLNEKQLRNPTLSSVNVEFQQLASQITARID
jgi:hypothetical protein